MTDKEKALATIRSYLKAGVLTEEDMHTVLATQKTKEVVIVSTDGKDGRLSAVDVMFYVAGIVFFAAIMSFIGQSWERGDALLHIVLSAGIGVILWATAYVLLRNQLTSDVRQGLVNSLLLTGSLLIVVGGYIIANEIVGGYGEVNFIPGAIALAVVGMVHVWFDRAIKKKLILLMGILMTVVAFPAFMFGLLQDANAPSDIWSAVVIISAALLVYATRVVAKIYAGRQGISKSFDVFAAFVALLTMYISSYTGSELFWLLLLIISVLGVFYLCVIFQSKHLLAIASLFLVITVVTISFRYFSNYGISASLIVATIGLLGSAAVASGVNKKYLKS